MKIGGLPEELFEELDKSTTHVKIKTERRKFGKIVTIVELSDKSENIEKVAKELKKKLACGGAVKENRIELQGNHLDRIKKVLVQMGYAEDQIELP